MIKTVIHRVRSSHSRWRVLGWGSIGGIIAAPALAMRGTSEFHWTTGDFLFAAAMLAGVGVAFELLVRARRTWAYRAAVAVALGAGLLMLWANAAVGIVGSENQSINVWFNLIPLFPLVGAIGVRFRAGAMAIVMAATALAQLLVGAIVQHYGHFAWVFTLAWTAAWLLSALLFRKAANQV